MLELVMILEVPENPGIFFPGEFIRAGMPRIRGVGEKLAKELEGLSCTKTRSREVGIYRSSQQELLPLPTELASRKMPELGWWTLYQFLVWPHEEMEDLLEVKGLNLGCPVSFPNGDQVIRVKLDWEDGHHIGFRQVSPSWIWNTGTLFAICHD